MKNHQGAWILQAAAIAFFGAAIHIAAIFGGAEWFAYFGAPPIVVASARSGTWLAPVSAFGIAVLMAIASAYALSAAGMIRRLPMLRTALATLAVLCLLRGLLLIPLAIKVPELVSTFEVIASAVWALAGVGFAVGFLAIRHQQIVR